MPHHHPANIVLLAAGRGTRLAPLTDQTHKSLLPIAGKAGLQWIVDAVAKAGADSADIVCVTGHRHDDIRHFLSAAQPSIRTVRNEKFAEDVNILSTQLGVEALRDPGLGYLIIETDIVMEPDGWAAILKKAGEAGRSFWPTHGRYGTTLTGGALQADKDTTVTGLVYAPNYDSRFEGWEKLLGMLYVGPDQVADDRRIRNKATCKTISQYYMTPWIDNLQQLPCSSLNLSQYFASSFNDMVTYEHANADFERAVQHG